VQYEGLEQSPNIIYTGAAPNQQIIPAVKWCCSFPKKKRLFLVGSDYREVNMVEPSDKETFPSEDEREYYRVYRERVVHEDTLIYQRLSFLITAQTIMFSFTAVAFFRTGAGEINTKGTIIMCVLGMLTCLVSYVGVLAALHAIQEINYNYQQRYPS